jgi:DNA recombination protein RmuC
VRALEGAAVNELAIVLLVVTALSLGLAIWAVSRRGSGGNAAVEVLERQLESARAESRDGQAALQKEMSGLQLALAQELKAVSGEVSHQLQEGMKLVQSGQTAVGERLDRAATVVGEVQGSLGKLAEATQRVAEVGRDLQGLERILKSPKIRGGLGETLLAELLAQMLPREHYELQYGFKSGEKVDAVIRIGPGLVPVDAKFPLENFRRMVEESDEERRQSFRKAFGRDVKLRIEEIAKKYILPDEDTFDFALMYVPAENVYYETIVKDDASEDESIATYALSRRVVPVSPNSLYAYLQVIILGLRGLRIEANAREIQNDLIRLGGDIDRVREHFDKVRAHLGNAQKQFEEADRDLGRFEAKLEAVEGKVVERRLPEAGASPPVIR